MSLIEQKDYDQLAFAIQTIPRHNIDCELLIEKIVKEIEAEKEHKRQLIEIMVDLQVMERNFSVAF